MKSITFAVFGILILSNFTHFSGFESFDSLITKAKEENKKVLIIFSGSDWCKPCILLKKNILDTQEYATYADSNFVTIHLDFPYKKANKLSSEQTEHNGKYAEIYNPDGVFPRVLILDNNKTILGEASYSKSMKPSQFIDQLKEISK